MSAVSIQDPNSSLNQMDFQKKLQSISKPNWFNRYLIVKKENNGLTLGQTNVLGYLWEKLKGITFGLDMADKTLVELVTIDFLEKNQKWVDASQIEQIQELANRNGLKPSKMTQIAKVLGFESSKHEELTAIFHSIQDKINPKQESRDRLNSLSLLSVSLGDSKTEEFIKSNETLLANFNKVIRHMQPHFARDSQAEDSAQEEEENIGSYSPRRTTFSVTEIDPSPPVESPVIEEEIPRPTLGKSLADLTEKQINERILQHRNPAINPAQNYDAVALSKGPFDAAVKEALAKDKQTLDQASPQERAILIANIKEKACREVYQTQVQVCTDQGFYDPEIIPYDIAKLLGPPTSVTQHILYIDQIYQLLEQEVDRYQQAGKLNQVQAHRLKHDAVRIAGLYREAFPNKSYRDIFLFVQDLVRIATYQEYYDKSSFNGSDHGSKHIHNNISGAQALHEGMHPEHYTIKDQFMEELVHFYHDIGYTVGLASTDFNCCKDHPFIGARMIESNRDYFMYYLDETSYNTLHDCVLCHAIVRSDLTPRDEIDEMHPNLVRAVTSISDACAVTYDRKTQEFWEQPRALVALAKIKSFLILFPEYTKKLGDDIVKGPWKGYDEHNPIDKMAYDVYWHTREELLAMVGEYDIPHEKKGLFRQAIEQQFNAFKANITLGQYGAVLVGLEAIPNPAQREIEPAYIPQVNMAVSIAYGILKDLYGDDQANDSFKKLVGEFNGDMKDLTGHLAAISKEIDAGRSTQDVVVPTGVAQFKLLGRLAETPKEDPHRQRLEQNLSEAIGKINEVFKLQTASLFLRGTVMKKMDEWIKAYEKNHSPPFSTFVTESLLTAIPFFPSQYPSENAVALMQELISITAIVTTSKILDANDLQKLKSSVALILMSDSEYEFMRGADGAITRQQLLEATAESLKKTIKEE